MTSIACQSGIVNITTIAFVLQLLSPIATAVSLWRPASETDDTSYGVAILDPDSPFGSPYGGYSRATENRLLSLPLKLPNLVNVVDDFKPTYFQMRDFSGRSFSCRSYHEDELDPIAMNEGMFEWTMKPAKTISNKVDESKAYIHVPEISGHNLEDTLLTKLATLQGICAQLHQGWWSYEWCYGGKITQFHVEFRESANKEQIVTIEDLTSLGIFSNRKMTTPTATSKDSPLEDDMNSKKYLDSIQVSELFVDGDICAEARRRRETTVLFQCCSNTNNAKRQGTVMYNGAPFETELLYIQSVAESTDHICVYTMTICTQLVCDVEARLKPKQINPSSTGAFDLDDDLMKGENHSVSEILELTFARTRKKCIEFGTGAWWVYEFCPGRYIRQFHEVTLLDRVSGVSTTAIETEHVLGRFNKSHPPSRHEDWIHVVNVTTTLYKSSSPPTIHGGNGAFFAQEYTGGDICDNEDVTDSAIKAGEIGQGRIERSATVRYGCGGQIEMTVKEDTTCHYVVNVNIPALCNHPLFRAPTSKRQFVKCMSNSN